MYLFWLYSGQDGNGQEAEKSLVDDRNPEKRSEIGLVNLPQQHQQRRRHQVAVKRKNLIARKMKNKHYELSKNKNYAKNTFRSHIYLHIFFT